MTDHYIRSFDIFLFELVLIDFHKIKGTVSVISSDPPCKDGNARFTTVPLKALSDQI